MTVNIAILGSCTTRDSVPWWPDEWSLVGYGARHPLASMLWPSRVTEADRKRAECMTPWRRRQFLGDISSETLYRLAEKKPDVLFLDVTDDRLGVTIRPDGGRAAGGIGPLGSPETIRSALTAIKSAVPLVVLNAVEWANGHSFNHHLRKVSAIATEMGIPSAWTRGTTSEPDHQWGPSPFHLIHDDYSHMVEALKGTL